MTQLFEPKLASFSRDLEESNLVVLARMFLAGAKSIESAAEKESEKERRTVHLAESERGGTTRSKNTRRVCQRKREPTIYRTVERLRIRPSPRRKAKPATNADGMVKDRLNKKYTSRLSPSHSRALANLHFIKTAASVPNIGISPAKFMKKSSFSLCGVMAKSQRGQCFSIFRKLYRRISGRESWIRSREKWPGSFLSFFQWRGAKCAIMKINVKMWVVTWHEFASVTKARLMSLARWRRAFREPSEATNNKPSQRGSISEGRGASVKNSGVGASATAHCRRAGSTNVPEWRLLLHSDLHVARTEWDKDRKTVPELTQGDLGEFWPFKGWIWREEFWGIYEEVAFF